MHAIYPGSFDPFTNGHLDIVERALQVADHLVIAVLNNTSKKDLFTPEQRIELIRETLKQYKDRVSVESFSGLLVDFCRKKKIPVVMRGLRAVSDFDYEHAIYLMNKKMYPEFETIFLMSGSEHSFISSTIVKEVASLGGEVADQVPQPVYEKLLTIYPKK